MARSLRFSEWKQAVEMILCYLAVSGTLMLFICCSYDCVEEEELNLEPVEGFFWASDRAWRWKESKPKVGGMVGIPCPFDFDRVGIILY